MRLEITPGTLTLTLSRRNLYALLHKLELDGSARRLVGGDSYLNGENARPAVQRLLRGGRRALREAPGAARRDASPHGAVHLDARARGMKLTWSQPVCDPCWSGMHGNREPLRVRLLRYEVETCSFCGSETRSGIYLRCDPRRVAYPRLEPDPIRDSQDREGRLWLLRARLPHQLPVEDPWHTEEEVLQGAVVRALDQRQARLVAQAAGGAETRVADSREERPVWLVNTWTVCGEIPNIGPPALILADRGRGGREPGVAA